MSEHEHLATMNVKMQNICTICSERIFHDGMRWVTWPEALSTSQSQLKVYREALEAVNHDLAKRWRETGVRPDLFYKVRAALSTNPSLEAETKG